MAYIYRSEEQMALVMKTIIEDQYNSKSSDAFLPLQEYFYVWLSGAYHDPCVVLSTACSILVALETYGSNCAYASIAGQALEHSTDVLCALRFRYLALIHALFVTLHNALKASDSQVLLDPQTVLNQWCAPVLVFQSSFWCWLIFHYNCRTCDAYKGLPDSAARAASDEYYSTVFRLPVSDRINPHAFSFTIAKMILQRSDPRLKHLNLSLRSLMHDGEGPFWKALNNARRALKVDLGSTLIVCCLLLSGLPSSSDVCEND